MGEGGGRRKKEVSCCDWEGLSHACPQTTTGTCISLSVAPPLMERSYKSIPNRVLTAHTE